MKQTIGIVALGLVLATAWVALPVMGSGQDKGTAICSCSRRGMCHVPATTKIEVQNTEKGVTIVVEAEKPEDVKSLQVAFVDFGKAANRPPCSALGEQHHRDGAHRNDCSGFRGTNAPSCSVREKQLDGEATQPKGCSGHRARGCRSHAEK
jgi:hypothetical protein